MGRINNFYNNESPRRSSRKRPNIRAIIKNARKKSSKTNAREGRAASDTTQTRLQHATTDTDLSLSSSILLNEEPPKTNTPETFKAGHRAVVKRLNQDRKKSNDPRTTFKAYDEEALRRTWGFRLQEIDTELGITPVESEVFYVPKTWLKDDNSHLLDLAQEFQDDPDAKRLKMVYELRERLNELDEINNQRIVAISEANQDPVKQAEASLEYYNLYEDCIFSILQNTLGVSDNDLEKYKPFITGTYASLREKAEREISRDFSGDQVALEREVKFYDTERIMEEQAIRQYIYSYVFPRELVKHDIYMGDTGKNETWIGLLLKNSKSSTKLGGFAVPVDYFTDKLTKTRTQLNVDYSRDGVLVDIESSEYFKYQDAFEREQRLADFKEILKLRPDFSFTKSPAFLDSYFRAASYNFYTQAEGLNKGKYVKAKLDETIKKFSSFLASRSFLESLAHQSLSESSMEAMFWGANALALIDQIPALFKDDSICKFTLEAISDRVNMEDFHNLDYGNPGHLYSHFIAIESNLRALSQNRDPIDTLVDSLVGIVVPSTNRIEDSEDIVIPIFVKQVMLSKMLTEELLPDGLAVSSKVDWNELLLTNLSQTSLGDFIKEWESYRRDSSAYNDKNGLMQLRYAWYQFFDEKMGRFDKYKEFMESKELQKAAHRILNREYISYIQRDKLHPDWKDYFKEHLAVAV